MDTAIIAGVIGASGVVIGSAATGLFGTIRAKYQGRVDLTEAVMEENRKVREERDNVLGRARRAEHSRDRMIQAADAMIGNSENIKGRRLTSEEKYAEIVGLVAKLKESTNEEVERLRKDKE